MGQLTVYEAISAMRKLSARGQEVSYSLMSHSEFKQETEGIVEVRPGRLRSRSPDADFLNREFLVPTPIYYTHILVLSVKSVKKT